MIQKIIDRLLGIEKPIAVCSTQQSKGIQFIEAPKVEFDGILRMQHIMHTSKKINNRKEIYNRNRLHIHK